MEWAIKVCLSSYTSQGFNLMTTLWISFFEGVSCINEVSRCIVFALHLKVKASGLGERISSS